MGGHMNDSTMLSIKEFAKFAGVNQSTLRYYDEIDLLPPAGRGENNYRYYIPFQIITLNFINVLIGLGVPLATIKKMSKERTPKSMIELLHRQEIKLDYRLYELRTAYSIIHTFNQNIQNGLLPRDSDIAVEELDETRLVLGPDNNFENHDTFYENFMYFCNAANDYRINLRYPVGGYHGDMNAFLRAPGQPDKFFSLDPIGNAIQKRGPYLVCYHNGYYGDFGDIPNKMVAFAKDNKLAFHGPVYIVYLLDEISIIHPDQYLARIAVGVTAKKDVKTRKIRKVLKHNDSVEPYAIFSHRL